MATFRLLHVSDLHVAAKPDVLGGLDVRLRSQHPRGTVSPWRASSWNVGLGAAVCAFAERNHKKSPLDAILVSGDLATTGGKADLVRALDYVEQLFNAARWTTGPASHPGVGIRRVILFPGNHDRFRTGLFFPGGSRFDVIFASYWQGPLQTTILADALASERLAVIQADFSLRKRRHARWASLDYLGQGRVYRDVLDRLTGTTSQHLDGGTAVVWAVHFPPAFVPADEGLRLQDQMNLIFAARDLKVPCLFAGHTHLARRYTESGVVVCCAGTATQLVAPPGTVSVGNSIHPCTISVRGGRVTNVDWQIWGWDPNVLAFQPRMPAGPPLAGWIS